MGTLNLAQEIKAAIDEGRRGTAQEILPAKGVKGKSIRTLRNGFESRAGTLKKGEKGAAVENAKAKKSRRAEAGGANHYARTGAKDQVIAATPPLASSLMTARKGEEKGHGKTIQRHCRRKQ
jgi:hypothetical protein